MEELARLPFQKQFSVNMEEHQNKLIQNQSINYHYFLTTVVFKIEVRIIWKSFIYIENKLQKVLHIPITKNIHDSYCYFACKFEIWFKQYHLMEAHTEET